MKRKVISISSGEYVYHQIFNKAVGKIINGQPTGRGNDGKVVQFGYNTALKLWHEDLNPAIKEEYLNNIENMLNEHVNYQSIILPKKLVECNGQYVGYTMKYFPGRNLEIISNLTSFKALLKGLAKLERDIYLFSQKGYQLDDIHYKNIMVNQKHKIVSFAILDADSWQKLPTYDVQKLYISNLSKIREIIFNVLLDNEIKEFIENDEELSYAYELIIKNQSEELSTFLYEVYVRISNKEKKRIRTLGDFKIS